MGERRSMRRSTVLALLGISCLGGFGSFKAEEVTGKWRIEVSLGGLDPGDSIRSDSANATTVQGQANEQTSIPDPRLNSSSIIESRISTDPRLEVRASYGLKRLKQGELGIEFGVGYYSGVIRNLELQYSFDALDPQFNIQGVGRVNSCETSPGAPACLPFSSDLGGSTKSRERWRYEPIEGGELKVIPISANLAYRFRPTKKLTPVLTAGAGYLNVDFTPSAQWEAFSKDMAGSYVDYVKKGPGPLGGVGDRVLVGKPHRIRAPEIDAPSAFFIESKGGVEYQIKPKLAFSASLGMFWALDDITITVDGRTKFGRPTQNVRVEADSPQVPPAAGMPAYVFRGGLRRELHEPNGSSRGTGPWPGEYYFNGGTLDYGGITIMLGLKVTL